jgi:hypothetical protein
MISLQLASGLNESRIENCAIISEHSIVDRILLSLPQLWSNSTPGSDRDSFKTYLENEKKNRTHLENNLFSWIRSNPLGDIRKYGVSQTDFRKKLKKRETRECNVNKSPKFNSTLREKDIPEDGVRGGVNCQKQQDRLTVEYYNWLFDVKIDG